MKTNTDARAPLAAASPNKGRHLGGITDIAGLKRHCRVDEGDCWIYGGKISPQRNGRSPNIYIRTIGRTLSIGSAVHFVAFGKPTPAGKNFSAVCGHAMCCNPEHRRRGQPGAHMRHLSATGKLPADWGAGNITPKPRKLTDEQIRDIHGSTGSSTVVAAVYGINPSYVCAIRAGRVRRHALIGARGVAGMFSQLLAGTV